MAACMHSTTRVLTHEQCFLTEGTLEGTTVVCPCHGAEFDVRTGAVLAPPALVSLKTYPVHVDGDRIVVEA
jgi:nitrite reductase/ring-hydroxylating ferredoxin subunit